MLNAHDIDELRREDLDVVCALIGESMNEEAGLRARDTLLFHFFCRDHGQDDGRTLLVARQKGGGRVDGVIGLHHYSWGPKDTCWGGWFAVRPELKGQGLGWKLGQRMIEVFLAKGYRRGFIETYDGPEFETARRFYERVGFRIVGRVEDYLAPGVAMIIYGMDITSWRPSRPDAGRTGDARAGQRT